MIFSILLATEQSSILEKDLNTREFSDCSLNIKWDPPLLIDGNVELSYNATQGNGSITNPYILENFRIEVNNSNGIQIKNTNAYFILRNCTIKNLLGGFFSVKFTNVTHANISNNFIIPAYNAIGTLRLESSNNNTIESNFGPGGGIELINSKYNLIRNNSVSYDSSGILLEDDSNYNDVFNNTARFCAGGLGITESHNNTISSNILEYHSQWLGSGYGLSLYKSTNNTLLNNKANSNQKYGISLKNSSNNRILNNIAINNTNGIYLEYSINNYLFNNTVNDNSLYGIELLFSDVNKIYNNTVINNGWTGIFLLHTKENQVYYNNIRNNQKGISLYNSNYTTVIWNELIDNTYCISDTEGSIGNIIQNNTCITPKPAIPGFNGLFGFFGIIILLIFTINKKFLKLKSIPNL